MRARLLQIIRSLGLSHPLDLLRYYWSRWRNKGANLDFRRSQPDFVLPPDYLMYESYKLDYTAYQRSGREAAEWIKTTINPFGKPEDPARSGLRILDWGCGPGRVVRHLPEVFGSRGEYYGCDPNERSIDWCTKALAEIDFRPSGLMPPLDYPVAYFDLLYGISIFTHLSEAAHQAWIEELDRILKPGGLALLTTHGPIYEKKLTPSERASYQEGVLIVRGKVQEGHRVFTAFQPPGYWRELVAPYFKVEYYQAGETKSWGLEQDVWVMKKLED